MWARCRDELFCDLAEVYGIYDPAALPARRLAVYAAGLREDSRVFMYINGRRASTSVLMQAAILDRLNILVWMQTEDGHKGKNRPESIYEKLSAAKTEASEEAETFDSAEAFMAARAEIMRGGG